MPGVVRQPLAQYTDQQVATQIWTSEQQLVVSAPAHRLLVNLFEHAHCVCACVCVCACLHLYIPKCCVCVCVYLYSQVLSVCAYVSVCMCLCVQALACVHVCWCICMGMCVCGYVHVCACVYACKCLCVHLCVFVHLCMLACGYIYICLYACSCHMPLCSYIHMRVWVGVWAFKGVWICAHYLHDQYGQSCVCGCQCPWPHHSSPLYGCEGCPDLVLTEAKRRNHTKSLSHAWQHCKKKHPIFSSTQIISKHILSSLWKLFQGEITWSCLVVLESISG